VFTGSSAFADDDGCTVRAGHDSPVHDNLSPATVAIFAAHHMMNIIQKYRSPGAQN
jgi:hypothetical protein